jgi:hypothetical protein
MLCFKIDKKLCIVNKILTRDQIFLKRKMCKNRYDSETSTQRMNNIAYRENLTKLFESVERKKKIIIKEKKIKFRQTFRIINDSSSKLWRLTRWTRSRSHKSRETSKISNLSRRNAKKNIFKTIMNFEFKTRMLSKFFFSNTIEIDFIDMSNYNYFNLVSKSISFISKNEIKQTIKKCKFDNASKSNDIFNRIFKCLSISWYRILWIYFEFAQN